MGIKIPCQVTGCGATIEHDVEAIAIAMYNSHNSNHLACNAPPTSVAKHKAPKMDRPRIGQDVSEEAWNSFLKRWDLFKKCTEITHTETTAQLFQCCEEDLGNNLLKEHPAILDDDEQPLLEAIKKIAVIPVAISVRRADLLGMKQAHGESIRSFYAKVKGKAATCGFITKCACTPPTDVEFTSIIIRDVIVAGLADTEIKRDVLGWENLDKKSVVDVIAFIENKEMAINALAGDASTAGVSSFKKLKRLSPSASECSKTSKCPKCSKVFNLYSEGFKGWNSKPHQTCLECWKKVRFPEKSKVKQGAGKELDKANKDAETGGLMLKIGGSNIIIEPRNAADNQINKLCSKQDATRTNESDITAISGPPSTSINKTAELNHHIFKQNRWVESQSSSHPTIRLRMTTKKEDYDISNVTFPKIAPLWVQAITDTGAQSCIWSRKECYNSGFRKIDLIPVKYGMRAANNTSFDIDGAILVRLEGRDKCGNTQKCTVMVYITPDADGFYLSREAMTQLGIIPNDFPQLGAELTSSVSSSKTLPSSPSDTPATGISCDCPRREQTPKKLDALPFPCLPENNERMKEWLLDRYAASTFNTCPHQLLPSMKGPSITIMVDPEAKPTAAHTPATIPIHWQDQVERDLLRDEALGVIERVPHGEPTTWCHRMVITRKHDGGPRRTVDLSPLNKHCLRETHAMKSPFQLARSVPPHTWKTVTDAWNGYHSVPIRKEDRHLTTFITPIGRYRYRRAPQGFLSSGDGYNRRFDEITADVVRKQRCVDDTLTYDKSLSEHWWRTIEFLDLLGASGIVLNPEKFQFAQKTVNFAGFTISDTGVEPLPKYIDAIKNFPTPKSVTDIRSWFGLVNQVSHYAQLRNIMAPFKPMLSPKSQFCWTEDHDNAFNKSKEKIVDAIKNGVEIFDPDRRTCLRPDWSKTGIGYYLSQKHCDCSSLSPGCCENGWRITLAGSRFLSSAEQRYAPVEGEMLAVAWSLEQTKYFTQGSNNLLVVTDHKPLVKLLGDRTLDEINNTRLLRIKQRTLMWKFEIEHQPGKNNHVADATSRHPVATVNNYAELASATLRSDHEETEISIAGAVKNDVNNIRAVTWQRIQNEMKNDAAMIELVDMIELGFTTEKDKLSSTLRPFWEYRNGLFVSEGIILYKDRVLVPKALRREILETFHSAHQGISAMTARAKATVFWPGITNDIQETRNNCQSCNRTAPSHARMPPIEPIIPGTPFEAVFADYFDFHGWHYLVMGDRLSGWIEVYRIKTGTAESGAKGLCMCMRNLFVTFGVPEELSSDGGPEFVSGETQDFFRRWGIRHRLSSAYHPQSNGRAEVAVKAAKRLLENNIERNGNLNTDAFVRAMLSLRNTPDPDCKLSPAQILFGHPLRDTMPKIDESKQKFYNEDFRPMWRESWAAKEQAQRIRYARTFEALQEHSRPLPPLRHGDQVYVQNQEGNHPKKWDRTGIVVECKDNDQYIVKIDGAGRLTLRNRRFLRKFTPHSTFIGAPGSSRDDPNSASHIRNNQYDTTELGTDLTETDSLPNPRSFTAIPASPMARSPAPAPNSAEPVTTENTTPSKVNLDESLPRRSSRVRKQTKIYDPAIGSYVDPTP